MIPIRDLNPSQSRPIVVWTLIALNVIAFLFEESLGHSGMQIMIERFGLVPGFLLRMQYAGSFVTPFTSMFLHAGFMHLIGNMWFLHIFGDNVEDALGKGRFLFFYLASGLGAALVQVLMQPGRYVPMVGASGAISGVLGAYAAIYPRARVLTLVPIFIFIQLIELPALVLIALWFGYQVLEGLFSLGGSADGGVAFFAHVGGFVTGLVLAFVMGRREKPLERYARAYY